MVVLIILYALSQDLTIRMGSDVYCNDCDELKFIVVVNLIICFLLISFFSIIYMIFSKIVAAFRLEYYFIDQQAYNLTNVIKCTPEIVLSAFIRFLVVFIFLLFL